MKGRFEESLKQLRKDIEQEQEAARAIMIMDSYAELYEKEDIYDRDNHSGNADNKWL